MRSLVALLLALAAIAPSALAAPLPSTGTVALSPDSEARWVSYALTSGNQLQFTAELDGAPVAAVLDTGASVSVMSRDYAARTGRRVVERGHAVAIGGRVALGWTPIKTLRFGGLIRAGDGLSVVALPASATGSGTAVDLLIGRDLLDRFALEIDPTARRFRLLPSGRMPFTGARAPLSIGQMPNAYVTELVIAGRRLRPVIVDTGDGGSLTLARGVWRTLPLDPLPVIRTHKAYGVGGPVEAITTQLPTVAIGQRIARDVDMSVEATGGFSDVAGAAGRIGAGLLLRYRLLLDPGAGHMILAEAGPPAP